MTGRRATASAVGVSGCLLALALIAPAGAAAAPSDVLVYPIGGGMSLSAGPSNFGDGAVHRIRVSHSGSTFTVTDTAGANAGSNCVQGDANTVTCSSTDVVEVVLNGGGAGDDLRILSDGPASDGGLYGFGGNDQLLGTGSDDFVIGGAGDDLLDPGFGRDYVRGRIGQDTVSYASRGASQPVSVDLATGAAGAPGEGDSVDVEHVIGGAGNDVLAGPTGFFGSEESGPRNIFTGGAGADRLFGRSGGDRLFGGTGPDRLFGGNGKDRLNGGAQRDVCNGGPKKDRARNCEVKRRIRR